MSPIYDLVKDRKVCSIEADSTVLEAARFMLRTTHRRASGIAQRRTGGHFFRARHHEPGGGGRTLAGNHKGVRGHDRESKAVDVNESMENCLVPDA